MQQSRGWDPLSDERRQIVHQTLNAALDRGINYIDTASAYGNGYSETLVGEVMRDRRQDCVLAPGIGAAQRGDLVPQHEQPGVFGGR